MLSTLNVGEMKERLVRWWQSLCWVFFIRRDRNEQVHELLRGIVILVVVAFTNNLIESSGLYEPLEWLDIDRLQNSATLTEAKKIFLVIIEDEDYERQFKGTSPLDKDNLTNLIAHICNSDPGVIGVDIATDHWWKDERYGDMYYEKVVKPKLKEGCRVVWAAEVRNQKEVEGDPLPLDLLGKVVGKSEPPPGVCTAVPVFPRDRDWVVRHYQPWVWIMPSSGHSPTPRRFWTFVSALAEYEKGSVCGGVPDYVTDDAPGDKKIRFSSDYLLSHIPAGLFLDAVSINPTAFRHILKDKIVILGVNHKHARDLHVTPLGLLPGPNVIGDAVFTARSAPIKIVPHWVSFVVHIFVGTVLLILLIWSGLRWLWATIASVLLTGLAAFVLVWELFNYGGYFFSVFGGLIGVVIAEMVNVIWDPLRDMWLNWMSEKPGSVMRDG